MKEYEFELYLISLGHPTDCDVLWKFFAAGADLGVLLADSLYDLKINPKGC